MVWQCPQPLLAGAEWERGEGTVHF